MYMVRVSIHGYSKPCVDVICEIHCVIIIVISVYYLCVIELFLNLTAALKESMRHNELHAFDVYFFYPTSHLQTSYFGFVLSVDGHQRRTL